MWYNKKVAAALGVQMPFSSLDELYQICEKAKQAGYVPIAFGAAASQKLWWIHLAGQLLYLIPSRSRLCEEAVRRSGGSRP